MTRGPIQFDVSVSYGVPRAGVPAPVSFRKWALAAAKGRILKADLAIRVVDTKEACSLNHHYRGKDYATNVLTFVYDDSTPLYGDVVICAPVVAREAKEQRKDMLAHYAHLTIHAALHLQGYDHEKTRDAEKMEARETALMLKLRYPAPYLVTEHTQ